MFGTYRQLLGVPGVGRLLGAGLVGRLPFGMASIAVLLLVRSRGGSYATAGLLLGVLAIAGAVVSPLQGWLIDRDGPRPVLAISSVVAAVGYGCLAVTAGRHATAPALLCAALAGGATPPLAPVFRANLPRLLGPGDLLTAGFAIDSTLQELIFITGPLLVVVSTVPAGAGGALVVMALLVLAGTTVFVSGRALDDAPRRSATDRGGSALASSGLRALLPIAALIVMAFAATEVAVVAAADAAGHRSIAGLLLATWAVGSGIGGLVYGSRGWPGSAEQRLAVLLFALGAMLTVPAAGPPLVVLALLLLAAGPFIAPAIACAFVLVQRVASASALTEAYTWLATAFGSGGALGAAIAGAVVDAAGWQAGFLLAGGALAAAAALTLAFRGILTGAAEG